MFYWILITLLHTTHKNTRRNKSHLYSYLAYIHHRPNYEQQALAWRLLQRGHYYTNSTVLFCETGYCLKAANSFELLSQKNSIIDVQQCLLNTPLLIHVLSALTRKSFIQYVCKMLRKSTCTHQGVRNVCFSENAANVLNE